MDQGGRVQGLAGRLPGHPGGRHPPQLGVHQGQEVGGRLPVAAGGRVQEPGHVVGHAAEYTPADPGRNRPAAGALRAAGRGLTIRGVSRPPSATGEPHPMPPADAVTYWIGQLKAGDRAAVEPLWAGYFQQVLRLARHRLRAAPRRAADEEDVAVSAFDSFCRAAEAGRLPRLADRASLWSHLFVYTVRKAHDLVERELAAKRGGGRVLDEAGLGGPADVPR